MSLTDTATTAGGYTDVQPGDVTYNFGKSTVVDLGGSAPVAPSATNVQTATAPAPLPPSAQQQQDQANGQNATQQIGQALAGVGLGGMTNWATSLAYALSGNGISISDIVNTVLGELNNPLNQDGSVNQDALAAFDSALPGYNQRIKETGNNGSPGASPVQAIAAYLTYQTQVKQFATQAGLTPGTITNEDIGNLWANNVSSNEVSERITLASTAAQAVPQEVRDHLQTYYGISTGDLASVYLNPTNTIQKLTQQFNTGVAGGAAATAGFGEISRAQANTLQAFLSSTSQGTAGNVGGINPLGFQTAVNAFQSNLGSNGVGGSIGTAAELAQGGFESTRPGQSTTGNVTQDQLLGAVEGNQADIAATAQAQQARTAQSRGGGGATTTAEGAVGLGFANQ